MNPKSVNLQVYGVTQHRNRPVSPPFCQTPICSHYEFYTHLCFAYALSRIFLTVIVSNSTTSSHSEFQIQKKINLYPQTHFQTPSSLRKHVAPWFGTLILGIIFWLSTDLYSTLHTYMATFLILLHSQQNKSPSISSHNESHSIQTTSWVCLFCMLQWTTFSSNLATRIAV